MKNSLDRNSFIPLYAQIHRRLRRLIDSGEIAPGAPVPSERELSEEYDVSRMTARQALRALRQNGLVSQERGLGTFVSKWKVDVHTRNLVGFNEDMRRRGLKPSSRLILISPEPASQQAAQKLGIRRGDEVYRLERLRLANREPMAYETNFIPAALCPGLHKHNFEKESLYDLFQKEYGIRLYRAAEVLEAAAAMKPAAGHLGVEAGTPVLVVHRVVYSDTDNAVESVKTVYRADRYRATFHLTKNNL
ncbi:MAG TPA: GntR family transcriptional regulator [Candidatus Dormibacteraeota bacterium]|nr:GntR family transcriptional regulator [Candidatus Dormibacteraeota bacterium]